MSPRAASRVGVDGSPLADCARPLDDDLKRSEVRIPAGRPMRPSGTPDRAGPDGREEQRIPAVRQPRRQLDHCGAHHRQVDRNPSGTARRQQPQRASQTGSVCRRRADGGSRILGAVARPQGAAHGDGIGEPPRRMTERHPVKPFDHLGARRPEAELEAPVGDLREPRGRLRGQGGRSREHRQHSRRERQSPGAGGQIPSWLGASYPHASGTHTMSSPASSSSAT